MTEIDPAAVFVSDEGEVRVFPDYAGKERMTEYLAPKFPVSALLDEEVRCITVDYYPLTRLPKVAQFAILKLLQERVTTDALLVRCDEAIHKLLRGSDVVISGMEWGILWRDLWNWKERRR